MKDAFANLLSQSGNLETVIRAARMIAMLDTNVLILGESGTGKELFAHALHQSSRRAKTAFITVNCAALPEQLAESELFGHRKGAFTGAETHQQGRIQAAHQGTLFLDEIGELPLNMQAKLLRFLENGECQTLGKTQPETIDARIVAATNRDLNVEVKAGRFRQDLYYRLNIVPLEIPPLRERKADIKLLLAHFTQTFAKRYHAPAPQFSRTCLKYLGEYSWAGNVRELKNFCERMVIFHSGQVLEISDLPSEFQEKQVAAPSEISSFDLPEAGISLEKLEVHLIRQALARTYGNCSQAARLLGLSRDTLLYRMKKYTINS
jgi:transcriptional regulator with PAS, ATPase and Fis domain